MRTYTLSLILLFLSCLTSPFTLFALDDESTEITEVLESLHAAWDADEYRAYRINIDTPPIQQQTVVESLKATIAGDDVDVDWITKDEYDVDYFELYAAVDAKPYKSIQKIKPDKGKGEGANKKSYKQKDKDKRKENQQAKRIYYRLHQVTKKGEDQILAVAFASASSSGANDPDVIDNLIPQLTPKSPEVAAMERFGQYPVSHYTGIADISIPIYTIKVGDLTIPIELKYHAGGHRVSDVAPRQGLGWSISGLYSLSRQVRGQVDEMSGTGMLGMQLPTFNLSCISDSDKSLLDQHINFGADMERDIFTYRTPLRSNSFVLTPDSTYFLEADRAQMSFAGGFNDFTIRDDHGNRYIYDIKENSSANHVNNTTAWHVSEILTTQPGEKLAYTYYGPETVSYETDRIYTQSYITDLCDPYMLSGVSAGAQTPTLTQNSVTIVARPIKEIFFPGGKIHFVLEQNNRQDLAGGKAIDKIDIYGYDFEDNAYRKIRSFDLQYVYKTRTGGSKVLFLDKVVQRDTSDGPIGTYELSYNSTALPALHSIAIDAQGYFNNEGNSTLIPSYSIPYSTTCTGGSSTASNSTPANRNSSATYMDAWMLEQIDYPTGGSTTFEYEPHQYNNMGTPTLVGGLRIKKIVSDSGSGTIARSYRYGVSESGNGTFRDGSKLIMRTDQEINQDANTGSTNHYKYKIIRLTSGVNTMINPFEGVPVTYPEVTEYEDATAAGTVGKTVYTFKDDISDGVLLGNAATSRQVLQSRHWGRGQLLSKKVYGNDGRLKVEETNTYQAIIPSNPTPTLGYVIGRWYDEIIPGTENGQGCLVDDDQYMLNQYSWYPGLLKLNSTVSRSYDDTDDSRKVERITERTYDSDYYQLTETKHINTDGDTRIQRFRYVTDLDNLTSSSSGPAIAYRRMHTNNQINTPIEIHSLRKSGSTTYYLSGLLTTYFTKTVGPETLVVPNDIFQTRIDPLSPPTSFNLVNITTGGAVTQDASYVHRLDMLSYSLRGKPATWKRPGNSTSAYEWSWALTNDVYHHRLDESILHDGSSAEHTTTYNSNIPLTGTDVLITPNGIETSYEYDDYGRFKRSMDDEGDILIEHDYVISSTGSNKVTQYVPRKGMSTLGTMVNDVMTDISFYDGLGRFEQRLLKEGAPNAIHQLVEGAVTYDNFGRIDRTYVTFHSTGGSTSKAGLPTTVHMDGIPYGRVKTYDLSPLHRPKQTLGPGNVWDTQNKYITNTYEVAPGNTIRKYVNGISGASVSGKYGANTLHMRKTISEQGNVIIEYLDNDGKIIQKSAQDSTGTYRHTAYIYDNYDRLRFVIQPESFETEQGFTIDDTYFKNGVFEYRYDSLGRLISTYEPGGGRSYTVYDRLDRPVLAQSAHQQANDKWSYIRYDAYGRVAHTGELTSSIGQSTLADQFKNITQCYETFSSGSWTTVSFPSGLNSASTTIKEENVYDSNTPWNSLAPFDANHAYHTNISDVTGLRTGQFSYDSDNPNTSYFTVWYYDYKGRVIQTIRSHHLSASMSSPKKIITSFEYNHVGDVLRTKTTFQIEGESDIVHIDSTTYDHRSRPLYYASGVNTAAEVICQIDYDVTGRMARKIYQPNGSYTKGGTNDYIFRPPSPTEQNTEDVARVAIILDPGTEIDVNTISSYSAEIDPTMAQGSPINGLQTVQFHYNIRDWVTGINLNGSGQPIPNTSEGDLFSIKMEYESAGRYDGTMGKLSWAHHDESLEQRSYVYSYDAANRIKMADYTGEDSEDYTVENLLYDKNGNIKQLQRMGKSGTGYAQIDNLSYVYAGNHLMRVSDSQTDDHEVDFVDRNTSDDDYEYHPDGCLKKDLNENISDITYDTYLKKPILITLTTGATIKYIYDGNGTMIRRQHSGGTVWDYIGRMILKNGVPYEIAMAEGRVMNEEGTWRNEYEYRDNVGNLRVSFTERDGKLQQTYAAGYTPFGLAIHPEANSPVPCRYTFHGHEDHGDFGLRLTSMGARCYNQTIGRFISYDALSMKASSWTGYRLGWNQPMNVNDPTGNMEPTDGYGAVSSTATGSNNGSRVSQDNDEVADREIVYDRKGNPSGVRLGFYVTSGNSFSGYLGSSSIGYTILESNSNRSLKNCCGADIRQDIINRSLLTMSSQEKDEYLESLPSEYIADALGGASDFRRSYREMREANWKNSDKYFHAKANFLASSRGPAGNWIAKKLSNAREWFDMKFKGNTLQQSMSDQRANMFGRQQSQHYNRTQYRAALKKYVPSGLPNKY